MEASETRTDPGPEPGRAEASAEAKAEASANRTDRQALLMVAVVFLITLASWGSAEFACNRRPPQYKDPAATTTAQLASTPKDAAIEFRQRELTSNFAGALELAVGAVAEDLKPKQEQCVAAPSSCKAPAPGTVFTKAELVRYEGPAAIVKAISTVSGQPQSVVLRLEKSGTIWKVVEREKA